MEYRQHFCVAGYIVEITVARTAGFCMGVQLALDKLDALVAEKDPPPTRLVMLGPIIHNPLVMESYTAVGVLCLPDCDDIRAGDRVIVRAHGIPKELESVLRSKGAVVTDATCPKVKKAQLHIAHQAQLGATLLLFGEANHPEVRGLVSYAGEKVYVFSSLAEIRAYVLCPETTYCLAAQTTQDKEEFQAIVQYVQVHVQQKITVLKTICDATRQRQNEVMKLTARVNCMIVVGGKNSGNTRRLAEISRNQGTPTFHVENFEEISFADISPYKSIGLTAGASTPDSHILAMQEHIMRLMGNYG